jgi:predicted CoA-binding protein
MRSVKEILESATVIAVVGCSDKPWRDSHRIANYLMLHGYKVYPVNPRYESVLGERCYPNVASVPEHVDIVDVFRNPAFVPDVVEDAIAAGAGALWLQLGIAHPEAEERARRAGLEVVSDRCIAVDHRVFGIAAKGRGG